MKRYIALAFSIAGIAWAQTPSSPQATTELANSFVERLAGDLNVKTTVGKPVTIGSVTLIPVLMLDINFGGGQLAMPPQSNSKSPQGPPMSGDGFLITGEARPLGFVVVSPKGTRFLPVGKAPAK